MTTMAELRELASVNESELEHHGVKGMKWGVRHDRAEGYSDKQYKQDTAVYGRRGANRVNSSMKKGYGVRGARSIEKTKHDAAVARSKPAKKVGSAIGGIGGVVLGTLGTNYVAQAGAMAISGWTKNPELGLMFSSTLRSIEGRAFVAAGAAAIGSSLGGALGKQSMLKPYGYSR